MTKGLKKLIDQLAYKMLVLEGPIHLLAVCTGGMTLTKEIALRLGEAGKQVDCFEVWTNLIDGKREISKTDFTPDKYQGTVVIIEDVIWQGRAIPPIKDMLEKIKPNQKIYIAALLDCEHRADFSVFH